MIRLPIDQGSSSDLPPSIQPSILEEYFSSSQLCKSQAYSVVWLAYNFSSNTSYWESKKIFCKIMNEMGMANQSKMGTHTKKKPKNL